MKQKKIAFVISSNEIGNWSGGISYFRNLFKIIKNINKNNVIVYTDSIDFLKKQKLNNFFKIKKVNFLKKNTFSYFLRKLLIFLINKDLYLYCMLLTDNISILSHRKLFKNKQIKSIGWIPDLQHKVLKKFFQDKVYLDRERYIINEIKNSDKIFVSSFQVKKEFKYYYNQEKKIVPLRILSEKQYSKKNKEKKYLLFPAQFWEHKNHKFLLKVGKIIKNNKINIKIYFCGKVENYKNKSHYSKINNQIKNDNLADVIKNFGEVSLNKLEKLQNESIAFVSPSLYEGWSTINEESRSKLKFIFLSNIKGHLEQKNYGSIFFNLKSPESFIHKLKKFLKKKPYKNKKKFKKENEIFIKKLNSEVKLTLEKEYK